MKANITKIMRLRKSKGLAMIKLAEILDITTRTIYNWERGKSFPSKAELIALSHLYNVRLSEISNYKDFPLFYTKPTLLNKNETATPSSEYISGLVEQLKAIPDFNFYPILKIINEYGRLTSENTRKELKIKRLSSIIDSIDSVIYTKDHNHKIRFFNKKFLSLLPQSIAEEKISGSTFKELFFSDSKWKLILELEKSVFSSGMPVFKNNLQILPEKSNLYICPLVEPSGNIYEIMVTFS